MIVIWYFIQLRIPEMNENKIRPMTTPGVIIGLSDNTYKPLSSSTTF
jgi:hypothetical protein